MSVKTMNQPVANAHLIGSQKQIVSTVHLHLKIVGQTEQMLAHAKLIWDVATTKALPLDLKNVRPIQVRLLDKVSKKRRKLFVKISSM